MLPCAQAPAQFEREEVRERLRKLPGGPTQPLTVHLRQEIDRLNSVIALTTAALKNMRLAVAGACTCAALPRQRLSHCVVGLLWNADTLSAPLLFPWKRSGSRLMRITPKFPHHSGFCIILGMKA